MTDNRSVYFIGAPDGLIKIGVSKDPTQRLAGLQTSSPLPLCLLAVIPHIGFIGERDLHVRFARDRAHGEWFRPSPELLALISESAAEVVDEPAEVPLVMTTTEVAKLLRKSTDTVLRMAQRGDLSPAKVGRQHRFRRAEVVALWAATRSDEPAEVAS